MNQDIKTPSVDTDPKAIERQEIWHDYRMAKLLVATQLLWFISDRIEAAQSADTESIKDLSESIRTLSEIS
jgi:hypothetical protein